MQYGHFDDAAKECVITRADGIFLHDIARRTWMGTAAPAISGLRIDPCIPSAWSGFSAARRFRGKMMRIAVHNPKGVCKGVVKMTVDGKEMPGNLIPVDLPADEHQIEVWLD